jgi:hypothetical protein
VPHKSLVTTVAVGGPVAVGAPAPSTAGGNPAPSAAAVKPLLRPSMPLPAPQVLRTHHRSAQAVGTSPPEPLLYRRRAGEVALLDFDLGVGSRAGKGGLGGEGPGIDQM